jgi:hypothetical protein
MRDANDVVCKAGSTSIGTRSSKHHLKLKILPKCEKKISGDMPEQLLSWKANCGGRGGVVYFETAQPQRRKIAAKTISFEDARS